MSNITGNSSTLDLITLVNNLTNTVSSVQSSFTNLNNNINSLNNYDSLNTVKINQINNINLNQDEDLENLQNVDIQTNNRINLLESKFPITDSSIVNNTISKIKISGLSTDLTNLDSRITNNSNNLTILDSREAQNNTTLTNNLNNQITKQQNDHNLVYNELHTLLSSTVGDSNTFQTQVDAITTDLTAEKIKTTNNSNSIQSNTNAINLNNNKILTLEGDNVLNKQNIQSNTNAINNNTNSITTINTNLNNLSNNVNTLTNTENTNHLNQQNNINTLTNNLSNLDTRETTHYNDLNSRLNNLQSSNTTDLTALENQLDLLDTRESTNYTNLNTKIDNQINKQSNDHSSVSSSITVLQNDLSVLNTRENNNYNSNLTLINTNKLDISDNIKPRLTNAENTIITHTSQITNNNNSINQLNNYRVDDKNDINNLLNDNNNNKINITSNTNDINILKAYDTSNTNNINQLNNKTNNNETEINTIKNTTIPNLSNKYLIKNDPINGDTFLGKLKVQNIDVDVSQNLVIGENANMIFLGSSTNQDSKTINIGGVNDTVNILGSTNYIQTQNVQIQDKVITLNKGSVGNNTSSNVSVNIRDNDVDDKGYIRVNDNMNQLLIKLPQNDTVLKIGENIDSFTSLTHKLYVDLQDSNLQSQIASNTAILTNHSDQLTNVNNQLLQDIPFSKINNYPDNNKTTLLYDDGDFDKLRNECINDNSIQTKKLVGVDNLLVQDKFLNIDGTFKLININSGSGSGSFNNAFTADVNANNHKVINLSDPSNDQDASTKSYVDNKYLSLVDASILTPTTQSNQPSSVGGGTFTQVAQYFNVHSKLNVDNNNIINVADPVNINDAVTKNYIDNIVFNSINNYLLNNSIQIQKLLFTGDGTKNLMDNGTWKDNRILYYDNINGYYLYNSDIAVNHIDEIGFSNFNSINNDTIFKLKYKINVGNSTKDIIVSCKKDNSLKLIAQSSFSLNGAQLTLDNYGSYNAYNTNNIENNPDDCDELGMTYSGKAYWNKSANHALNHSDNILITVNNNNFSYTNASPEGAQFNTNITNYILPASNIIVSSYVPFCSSGYNFYFNSNQFYLANSSTSFNVYNWPVEIISFLSNLTDFQNNLTTISDGVNSFNLIKNNNNVGNGFYIAINLTNGSVLTYTAITYSNFSTINDNNTEEDGRGNILFSVDATTNILLGNRLYFGGSGNYIKNPYTFLNSNVNYISLNSSGSQPGNDLMSLIDQTTKRVYLMDWGHDGSSVFSSNNIDQRFDYARTNIYYLNSLIQ